MAELSAEGRLGEDPTSDSQGRFQGTQEACYKVYGLRKCFSLYFLGTRHGC